MKIFLDTANLEDIKIAKKNNLINGVTTNPTHISKELSNINNKDIKKSIIKLIKDIAAVVAPDPVSVEITELEPKNIYEQAKRSSDIASNIVVKIPCYKEYISVINNLVKENIALNITLMFSLTQALLMSKLEVNYISPFIGRLNDIDSDGIKLIYDIKSMINKYQFKTQIIAASLRSIKDLSQIILSGVDIVTLPNDLLNKMIDHPLTNIGIKIFENDWKNLKINNFP